MIHNFEYYFNLALIPWRNSMTLIWNFSHEYTWNFGQRPSKTPTAGENPRKRKLSLKENSRIFPTTQIISLPTLTDKFTQTETNGKIPRFLCQQPVVWPHMCVVQNYTFYHMFCMDCTFLQFNVASRIMPTCNYVVRPCQTVVRMSQDLCPHVLLY